MKKLAPILIVLLAGCQNPQLGIGATFSGSGVSVTPSMSGQVGDVTVAVSK
jgi:hypothetical protein